MNFNHLFFNCKLFHAKQEEMTEWMGAIGRSIDIAKERIKGKYVMRVSNFILANKIHILYIT
jgi:hypothetical protein